MPVTIPALKLTDNLISRLDLSIAEHARLPAIRTESGDLSFEEIDNWSRFVAQEIDSINVDTGGRVVVLSSTIPLTIASMLGVFRSGCVYTPLDLNLPNESFLSMLKEVGPSLVLLDDSVNLSVDILECIQELDVKIIELNPVYRRHEIEHFTIEVDGESPAYLFFTSGTTGKPKGIVGKLSALDHFMDWEITEFSIGPGDCISQFTQPTFDAFFRDCLVSLCSGACLCIPPEKPTLMGVNALWDWIEEKELSVIHCVPSLFSALLEGDWKCRAFVSLKTILMAGEPISLNHAGDWIRHFENRIGLVNLYGSTETTMVKYYHRVCLKDVDNGIIPAGKPMPGTSVRILDEEGRDCEEGEVHVITPHRTHGYFLNEEATQRAFIPLIGEANLAYRSGDIGRFLPDGSLQLLGRRDRQVKLNGVRLELDGIEQEIQATGLVKSCAVVLKKQEAKQNLIAKQAISRKLAMEGGILRLVAYIVLAEGVHEKQLRVKLEASLSKAASPSVYVVLENLPYNANGKVDRKRLPEPGNISRTLPDNWETPGNDTECLVAAIWSSVLGEDKIGRSENFFELGGDSLKAMQVLNRICRETKRSLRVPELLENPVLKDFAMAVELACGKAIDPVREEMIEILDTDRDCYPLTPSQQGLWFLWKMDPESAYYTCQGIIHIKGRFDRIAFNSAWGMLLESHEILRVQFGEESGRPVQRFKTVGPVDIDFAERLENVEEVHAKAKQAIEEPFNLSTDELWRPQGFTLAKEHHVLLLTMHEITVDLWTMRLLLADFSRFYRQALSGEILGLDDKRVGFSKYALMSEQAASSLHMVESEAFWHEQLAGELPVLDLPLDRIRNANPSYKGETQHVLLDESLTWDLKELSKREGCTLYVTLLSGLFVMMNRYTGQEDLIVGSPLAQRDAPETEKLAGFFLNMLPMRTQLNGTDTFAQFIQQIKNTVSGALSHGDYPFSKMLEWAKTSRDTSMSPVFQIMFNMLNYSDEALVFDDFEIAYESLETGHTKYDFSMYAQEYGDRLLLQIAYQTELFDRETIERFLSNLVTVYRSANDDASVSLSELNCLSADEYQRVVVEYNQTEKQFDLERGLADWFHGRVYMDPMAIALKTSAGDWSYMQLNERANVIAYELIKREVLPGDFVGICIGRSAEMIAAVLAVIKTGAAYVFLDTSYPKQRLEQIIEQAGCYCLLVDEAAPAFDFEGKIVSSELFAGENQTGNPETRGCVDDLLTLVYTSASTGLPKGVKVSQRSILNRLNWMWSEYPFNNNDVMVLQKSMSLVASTWECLGGLLAGIPTVIADRETVIDPVAFAGLCRQHSITRLFASPSLLKGVLDQQQKDESLFESLSFVATSAEPIPPAMVRRWKHVFPDVALYNLYGSSECSSNVTQYNCSNLDEDSIRVPIGRPLSNVQTLVLDTHLKPVPFGAVGELTVGGACLANGYLGMEAETEKRFVGNPFSEIEGERLYRTGDLVRWRNDGQLELVGRNDFQVKLRGFRIEPGDIEQALMSCDHVDSAVVLLKEDSIRGDSLVAFWTGTGTNEVELRKSLHKSLPDYMIPSRFHCLEKLPRMAQGKLDRKALLELQFDSEIDCGCSVDDSTFEGRLLLLWRKLLANPTIGYDDNFFDFGGHSLLAAQLFSDLEEMTGKVFPLSVLYRAPTVRELAKMFGHELSSEMHPAIVPIQEEGRRTPLFCVPPWDGSAIYFRDLPKHLGNEYPVYGLEPLDMQGEEVVFQYFDDMVDFYVNEIQAFCPDGALSMCGFSGGGMVAWEIARKLKILGRVVETLVLVDTSKPGIRFSEIAENGAILNALTKLRLHMKVLYQLKSPLKIVGYLNRIVSNKLRWWFLPKSEQAEELMFEEAMHKKRKLYDGYKAKIYEGDIALMRAVEQRHVEASIDRTLGWEPWAKGNFSVYDIPGDHNSLLIEENCGFLGKALYRHFNSRKSTS